MNPFPSAIKVHAFSVDQGRLLGSWEAHHDAVSCTSVIPMGGAPKLVTASWDCSVKVRCYKVLWFCMMQSHPYGGRP